MLVHVLVVDVGADEPPAEGAAVERILRRQRFWGNEREDEIKEMKKETGRKAADPSVHRVIIQIGHRCTWRLQRISPHLFGY